MKYFVMLGLVSFLLLAGGIIQQQAFSQPGKGPPEAFAPPRADTLPDNARARPGGPHLGDDERMWVIPGHGRVISPN